MDDRADNPPELSSGPAPDRTQPPSLRPAPLTPLHNAAAARIEPHFGSPAIPGENVQPSPFDASPRDLIETAPLAASTPPPTQQAGFFPPGVGLIPAALLAPTAEQPSAPPSRGAEDPAPAFRGAEIPQASVLDISPAPPSAPDTAERDSRSPLDTAKSYAYLAVKAVAYVLAGWMALASLLVVVYRFIDPPLSALMLQRFLTGGQVTKSWVPYEGISPSLVRAVLVSEDGRFCQHRGIDMEAVQAAIERSGDGTPRGASTISMQVAKNLFLWPSKSYVRKAMEVPLTLAMEALWPKRRIMEVYLNIAEWGPGIFGAEAAARYHFSKHAIELTDREAALLAVTLPNPFARNARAPGPGTRRLAALIQARANGASRYQTSCVLRTVKRQ